MYDKNKGFEYEKIAKKYLLDNGYEIVEENFSCKAKKNYYSDLAK